jgi:hypothetical protein
MNNINIQNFESIISFFFKSQIIEQGYKIYDKTTLFGRIMNTDLFQYINFQKPRKGINRLEVDFGIEFLFKKKAESIKKYISPDLGHRFTYFNSGVSTDYVYRNESELLSGVINISRIMNSAVFKWLDNHVSSASLFDAFNDRALRKPDYQWAEISLAYLHLRFGDKNKSFEIAQKIIRENPIHESKILICNELLSHSNDSETEIEQYLNGIVKENIKALKLNSFLKS